MKSGDYRKDRIAHYLREYTISLLNKNPDEFIGLNADEVAEALSINRTSASRDLNDLYRDGLVLKFLGKPTRYLHYYIISDFFNNQFLPNTVPIGGRLTDLAKTRRPVSAMEDLVVENPVFLDVANASLQQAARQAEAAIRYPNYGLHTLITGPHGIGKRSFARQMFEYGKRIGKFSGDVKIYAFDCQSAINSAQAGAQLFGTVDGFPTPASPGRRGLLDRAAGSILLLEEVQALPVPIQEELISLITHNTFARFGAGTVSQQSKLMLVATCSKAPLPVQQCRLLQYFPMQIYLPPLSQRTPAELFLHICQLLQNEAKTLQCEFHISRDVFYYLMCAAFSEDFVGLSGLIKSICSLVYSEQNGPLSNHFFEIRYQHLPHRILSIHPDTSTTSCCTEYLQTYTDNPVVIRPDKLPVPPKTEEEPPAASQNCTPAQNASVFQTVEYFLEKHLYGTYASGTAVHDKNPDLTAQVRRVFQGDPVLAALSPEDPLLQGLIYLLSPQVSENINEHISHKPDMAQLRLSIPEETIRLAKALDQTLCKVSGGLSSQLSILHAICLHVVRQRAVPNQTVIFAAFHGAKVSEAVADHLGQLYDYPLIPLPFSKEDTLESVLSRVHSVLKQTPGIAQALFFSDGIPLNSLHESVEDSFGIPAKTLCASSFEIMQQAMEKITRFHFTVSMIEDQVDSIPKTEAICKTARLSPFVAEAVQRFLVPSLTFIDFNFAINLLADSLQLISLELDSPLSDDISVKYYFHCAHMIERLIRKEPFNYQHLKPFLNQHSRLFQIIENALQPLSQHYGIRVPTAEIAYLVEIFIPA